MKIICVKTLADLYFLGNSVAFDGIYFAPQSDAFEVARFFPENQGFKKFFKGGKINWRTEIEEVTSSVPQDSELYGIGEKTYYVVNTSTRVSGGMSGQRDNDVGHLIDASSTLKERGVRTFYEPEKKHRVTRQVLRALCPGFEIILAWEDQLEPKSGTVEVSADSQLMLQVGVVCDAKNFVPAAALAQKLRALEFVARVQVKYLPASQEEFEKMEAHPLYKVLGLDVQCLGW